MGGIGGSASGAGSYGVAGLYGGGGSSTNLGFAPMANGAQGIIVFTYTAFVTDTAGNFMSFLTT